MAKLTSQKSKSATKGATSASTRTANAPPSPSEELLRYRCGEMTAAQYLAARIDRATGHLRGRVSSRRLDHIRAMVRKMCATDPVLVAMKGRLLRSHAKAGKR